jgi:lipopolysaccharide biosynthesis protein
MTSRHLVAICFHLGYIDRFEEFTPYIDNVLKICPNADIYISYRENVDPTLMITLKYPQAHIMKATRGCDTGAFLLQIDALLRSNKNYDYVFKIHTKSNNLIFNDWINQLLEKTAGSSKNVSKVIKLFDKDPNIGMIGGKRWILTRKINFQYFYDICQRCNIRTNGHFVGGTIFWIRFSILKKCFDPSRIHIEQEYSLCEYGKPSEPSYTHAWERIFGLLVSTEGYQIKGV